MLSGYLHGDTLLPEQSVAFPLASTAAAISPSKYGGIGSISLSVGHHMARLEVLLRVFAVVVHRSRLFLRGNKITRVLAWRD